MEEWKIGKPSISHRNLDLRYLVRDRYGRDLACVLFGAAAWKAKARDSFIGWSAQQRQERLSLIINNSRFLILPHVRVPHLASHILGTILRRLRSGPNIPCRCRWPSGRPVYILVHEPWLWLLISTRPKGFRCVKPAPFCAIVLACNASPGGLSQALDRLAVKVKPQYDALATELRQAPALHCDETSWWVAGPGWWLWVFTTQLLTFYVVVQSRGRELLQKIVGKDFAGVLVSDCLAIYDDATALQHKCYAHHHKAIRQAKALHPHQGEGFLCEVQAMLRAAVALQQHKADLSPESFRDLRQALQLKAVALLEPPRSESSEEAVRNRLHKQRDHLFTFHRSRRC